MRKIIIFLVFIAVCIYAYRYYHSDEIDYSMEEMLPQGTMIYLKVKDADSFFKSITENPIWKTLKDIDYETLDKTTSLSLNKSLLARIVNMDLTKDQKINFLIRRFFSGEVSVALYPPEENTVSTEILKTYVKDSVEQLMSSLVVISRLPLDVQLVDILAQIFNKYQKNLPTEIVPYKEYTYRTVLLPDLKIKLSFVRLKDFVIVGIGEKSIKRSIDNFISKNSLLSKDKKFIEICERHSRNSDMLGYIDVSNLMSFFEGNAMNVFDLIKKDFVKNNANNENERKNDLYIDAAKNKLLSVFDKTKGFDSIGLSINTSQITSVFFTLFFDEHALDKKHEDTYTCQPAENESIYLIPKDVLIYKWSNCFDPKIAILDIKNNVLKLGNNPALEKNISVLENSLNISIDNDLVPSLGNEIGGYLKDIKTETGFPMPNILFFVKINDSERFNKILNVFEEKPFVPIFEETHNNVNLKYLKTPFGTLFQPAYCFLNNYFMIGTSAELIKSSIDANSDKAVSLLDNESFKEVNYGLTGKNRGVQFIKTDDLMGKIIFALDWSNNLISSKEKSRESFQNGMIKKLSEVNSLIFMNNQEINSMKARVDTLEKGSEGFGADDLAQGKVNEAAFLKQSIEEKKRLVASLNQQSVELQKTIDGYNKNRGLDNKARRALIDEFLKPVLTSLESIRSIGLKDTSSEDFYETSVYIDSKK